MGIADMNGALTRSPWILVAGGFHCRGGMDRANLALAEHLLEQDIPVHLVTHSVDSRVGHHPLVTLHMVGRPWRSFLLGEFALAVRARQIARSATKRWPQAQVVVNGGNCIWPGVNWAHYVHRAWPVPRNSGNWLYRLKDSVSGTWARNSERAAYRKARLIISNSKRTSQEIVEYFQVDKRRVHTVYLGSDPEWGLVTAEERSRSRKALQIPDPRVIATFVGGLGYDHRKGFDVLFAAWQRLCAKPDWDVDLLAAGSGPAQPMWQARISEAGLSGRIRLLGFSNEIKAVLAAADLLVSPVRYEAYGLNVQEAICRGIPAMVTASAGVAERYEAEFAPMLIPDPEDVGDLVNRLLAWRIETEDWRAKFRSFGDRLRSRTWRDTAMDFVSIVQSGNHCTVAGPPVPALAHKS